MKVAAVQIAPVFLDAQATWAKLELQLREAAQKGARLAAWGETLIPGYPAWLARTGGAAFDDPDQKRAYASYWREAVELDGPLVARMRETAAELDLILMGGVAERASGSTYATMVVIGNDGELWGRHRKLKPTYEERLVWGDGDAEGLRTYQTEIGPVGGLNCWENWIPRARARLHDQGEILHVAIWPGSPGLTGDISRFMALEGRSWVISASGLLRGSDFSTTTADDFPFRSALMEHDLLADGGSVIVNPRGEVVAGPLVGEEGIIYADIDPRLAIEERQNFDYSGHYGRPDIFPPGG